MKGHIRVLKRESQQRDENQLSNVTSADAFWTAFSISQGSLSFVKQAVHTARGPILFTLRSDHFSFSEAQRVLIKRQIIPEAAPFHVCLPRKQVN